MFKQKETKMIAVSENKSGASETIRANLRTLEATEDQLGGEARKARQRVRETRAALDLAENDFVEGRLTFDGLREKRQDSAAALLAVDPADVALGEQRTLVTRCREALTRAEAIEAKEAAAEIGQRFEAWRTRYAAMLAQALTLTGEGEMIVAEASKRCPDLLAARRDHMPMMELTPILRETPGYGTSIPTGAYRWLYNAHRDRMVLSEEANAILAPFLAQMARLEAANEACRRSAITNAQAALKNFDWSEAFSFVGMQVKRPVLQTDGSVAYVSAERRLV